MQKGGLIVKHWYKKKSKTLFEQFDGSNELIDKYKLSRHTVLSGELTDIYYLSTLEGEMKLTVGDWIATGTNGEHWAVKDKIFKKTYVLVE